MDPSSTIDRLPTLLPVTSSSFHALCKVGRDEGHQLTKCLATGDLCLPDASLWLGFSDTDSIPSTDLQRRQEGGMGDGCRERAEEDPCTSGKPPFSLPYPQPFPGRKKSSIAGCGPGGHDPRDLPPSPQNPGQSRESAHSRWLPCRCSPCFATCQAGSTPA